MGSVTALRASDAIEQLAFLAGWAGGSFPVYLDGEPLPATRIDTGDRGRLAERTAVWDARHSRQVELGLPEQIEGLGPRGATLLWAWLEARAQAQRAFRFRPAPTIVLRIGDSCRRLCLWALEEEAPYVLVENSNKRLAYALHAPQKYAAPEKLRIPMPGTFLRVGRKRPAPVLVTRISTEAFAREAIVGRLREPPPPYMQRLREGKVKRR